ncbi:unnamed protein product [Urochloa humidicola]
MRGKKPESPKNFNDCVSCDELTTLLDEQRKFMMDDFAKLTKNIIDLGTLIAYVEHNHENEDEDNEEVKDEDDDDDDARRRDRDRECDEERIRFNRRGMGGNREHSNNDPFAKTKFTLIPFAGNANPEAYLD